MNFTEKLFSKLISITVSEEKRVTADRDDYYERLSWEALERVVDQHKSRVLNDDHEFIISAWKKAYPFGERKHRPYKIWNRLWNHAREMLRAGRIKENLLAEGLS